MITPWTREDSNRLDAEILLMRKKRNLLLHYQSGGQNRFTNPRPDACAGCGKKFRGYKDPPDKTRPRHMGGGLCPGCYYHEKRRRQRRTS